VLAGNREMARDRYSTLNLDPRRRQMLRVHGSMSIMTLVTRPPTEDDAAHVHPRGQSPPAAEPSWGCP
jgi:hypothetical protein